MTTTSTPTPSSNNGNKASGQSAAAEPDPGGHAPAKKERPVRAIKVGSVQVAIWRNLTPEGRAVFNATLERLYFDEKADKWDSTTSFGRRDMLELAKASDIAHSVMSELYENANRRVAARPVNGAENAR